MSGAPPAKPSFWVVALIIGSAMSAMHIFVPALPLIAAEFASSPGAAKLSVSLYMIALAAGQLVYGPLSDWFGRRPVLLCGMFVYAVTGFLSAVALNLDMLLAARILQGAGGCAGLVLGRAIVHDAAAGRDAASTISAMNTVLLVSPALAPMVGLWLAETWGWRVIPAALGVVGLIGLAGILLRLPETAPRNARSLREMAASYGRLVRFPPFLGQIIAGGLTTTTMFALLTSAPFILTQTLGRPLREVGALYTVLILGIMAGNVIAGRLLRHFGFETLMIAACCLGLVGGVVLSAEALAGGVSLAGFLVSGLLYTAMSGMMASLSLTRSVDLAPNLKGSASGLYGFSQMAIGAGAITLAGFSEDLALAVAAIMLASAGCGLALVLALSRWRRHGGKPLA